MKRILLAVVVLFALGAVPQAAGMDKSAALVYTPNFDGTSEGFENRVVEVFEDGGYAVGRVAADELGRDLDDSDTGTTVLVLPDASRLPLDAITAVQSFLARGGALVALNTPMFREVLVKADDRWMPIADFRRQYAGTVAKRCVVDWEKEDLSSWARAFRSKALEGRYSLSDSGPVAGQHALYGEIAKLDGWDSILKKFDESPFSGEDSLMVFSARSLGGATHLALEWEERDGSRWIATVPLSTDWTQYALTPQDFRYWESVPVRKGTAFNPKNAGRLGITEAFTHTGYADHDLKYEVGPIYAAKVAPEYRSAFGGYTIPPMEALYPGYKFFLPQDTARLRASGFAGDASPALPRDGVYAMHPRPEAFGYDKHRDWVWEPILVAESSTGEMRGTVGAMISHADGPYKGGMWVSIGIADPEWYMSSDGRNMLGAVAQRLKIPAVLLDGGADHYAYFEGQPVRLGMTMANLNGSGKRSITGTVRVRKGDRVVQQARLTADAESGKKVTAESRWTPERWDGDGFSVETEVQSGNTVIASGRHEINAWRPKEDPHFVTIREGAFVLQGVQWRPHGVNYMPSSGIGAEDRTYFEQWLSPQSYDPKVIQRDLERCARMGFNALSVFLYKDYASDENLIDLLIRMDRLGMKANVSLRPGTPMEAPPKDACAMIQALHLAENDTVFAYDLAWEPQFRPFERDPFNADWAAWIAERYGSIENAEQLWNFRVPRDNQGRILNYSEDMIGKEGPWNPYVAAYRRFLDTLLYAKYSAARTLVRAVDKNHFVSFRMSMASDPTDTQTNTIVYDFAYLGGAVDLFEPEAYGRIGDWERVKPGRFTREYARWANPRLPMIWAEAGVHAWDAASMTSPPDKLDFQAQFYQDFYRMMIDSAADGIFWWWYPGGFRVGEDSDYGVINPDGTDRPVTKVIRRQAKEFIEALPLRPITDWLVFDRDKHTNGLSGVYAELSAPFWDAVKEGGVPGLSTEGTGTDSATCPLTGVGNVGVTGQKYPPKYLDAYFDRVEVRDKDGDWRSMEQGETVRTSGAPSLLLRVTVTNLGEAALLCEGDAAGRDGAVSMKLTGETVREAPLPKTLRRFEQAVLELTLPGGLTDAGSDLEISLHADRRTEFGPRFRFRATRDF